VFLESLQFSGNIVHEDHEDLHAVLETGHFPADLAAAFIAPCYGVTCGIAWVSCGFRSLGLACASHAPFLIG
jgi:hypothetical protein